MRYTVPKPSKPDTKGQTAGLFRMGRQIRAMQRGQQYDKAMQKIKQAEIRQYSGYRRIDKIDALRGPGMDWRPVPILRANQNRATRYRNSHLERTLKFRRHVGTWDGF